MHLLRLGASAALALLFTANARATDYPVTTSAGSGTGSLAEAITLANMNVGPDRILFDIPGPGVQIIHLMAQLPSIQDSVWIDGYSQLGASRNTLDLRDDAIILIEIDGSALLPSAPGIDVFAGSSTISGLSINGFGSRSIALLSSNNVVEGNFLGLDSSGTVQRSAASGVYIGDAPGNRIGGLSPGARNVIACDSVALSIVRSPRQRIYNNFLGVDVSGAVDPAPSGGSIYLEASSDVIVGAPGFGNIMSGSDITGMTADQGSSNLIIQGNKVGTNAEGTAAVRNLAEGIIVRGSNSLIGGTAPGEGNIISGNYYSGIALVFGTGNRILGNKIGTDITGALPIPNAFASLGNGIATDGQITIGGVGPGEANTIAFNGAYGVSFGGNGHGANIRGNSIFLNGSRGLDFSGGLIANDDCDADTFGPTTTQNYPVLTAVTIANGMVTVDGTINSVANTTFALDVFSNDACDADGYGEGQTYLGSVNVTTDATCNGSFDAVFALRGTPSFITATATDPGGNTSQFSACFANEGFDAGVVEDAGSPAPDAAAGEDAAPNADATAGNADATAAQPDATTGNADAGVTADGGVMMEEDSGCDCSAAFVPRAAWLRSLAVLGVVLALGAFRKKRRG